MAKWRLAESLKQLRKQVNAAYPNRDKTSDGSIGDLAHSGRASDHNPNAEGVVTAIDIDEDLNSGKDTLEEIVQAIIKSRDKRVKYIIYESRITVAGSDLQRWKKYTGSNPHNHHAHISVFPDKKLYDSTADWDIGTKSAAKPAGKPAKKPTELKGEQIGGADSVDEFPQIQNELPDPALPPSDAVADTTTTTTTVVDETNQAVIQEQTTTVEGKPGTGPNDESIQVSQGGPMSRWLASFGGVGGVLAAIKGFASDNAFLIAIGIVSVVLLILAIIFRQIILDWLRMKLFADPSKYNVK